MLFRPSLLLAALLAASMSLTARARVSEVPSNPAAMTDVGRAAIHIEEGAYAQARELMEPWVLKWPDDAQAWSLLGFARRKTGSPETAMVAYERALALDPMHKGANEYLGVFWLELGQPDRARERLAILELACPAGCEERSELEEALAGYRVGASR